MSFEHTSKAHAMRLLVNFFGEEMLCGQNERYPRS